MTRDRAVSTVVSYVITLGITTLLIGGLLMTAGNVVESREDATMRDALDVVGERIASNLMAADRLATTDPKRTAVEVSLPSQLSGNGYTVTVNGSASTLVLVADGADATVAVEFVVDTPVVDTEVQGGNLVITLTPADELEVAAA